MSNSAVTIGPISLQDFEVPASIQFGGQQRLVIHRLSDGTRRVEPLGPDDTEVRFEGTFSGPEAETRARELNSLRISGATVWLTWQSFRYRVIVHEFSAAYRSRWWICYRVRCVIVHQPGTEFSGLITEQSLITGAISVATAALAGTQISLNSLSSAVAADGALVNGTAANLAANVEATRSLSAVQGQIDQQSAGLLVPNNTSGSPSASASYFNARLGCAGSLANATTARSYIGRIVASLGSAGG